MSKISVSIKRCLASVPRSGYYCAAVAFTVALVWSFMTPAFHVPDEITHFSYAQGLAETGKAPRHVLRSPYSQQQQEVMNRLGFGGVIGNAGNKPPWFAGDDDVFKQTLAQKLRKDDGGGSSTATNNPPLYYVTEIIPYKLASGTKLSVFNQLQLMRILSCFYAALTVLMIYLFLRELLPRSKWAWSTGALVCAFAPEFMFITSGVNNDSLFFTFSAALFYMLARTFRQGLNRKNALWIGLITGLGIITKVTFIGLVPGVVLALLFLIWRQSAGRKEACKHAASAMALMAAPVVVYLLCNKFLWDRSLWGTPSNDAPPAPGSIVPTKGGVLNYYWQFYVPFFQFKRDYFSDYPAWTIWFEGFVGRFGWVDYSFRSWVSEVALGVVAVVGAACAAALFEARKAVRQRLSEMAVYISMVFGLTLLVAYAGYQGRIANGFVFEQPRYLFPLLALYAAFVAVSTMAFKGRLKHYIAPALVMLAFTHNLFALFITVQRYYS